MLVTMTAFGPRPWMRLRPSEDDVRAGGASSSPCAVDAVAASRFLDEIKLVEGEPVGDSPLLLKLVISGGWVALVLAAGSIVTGLGWVGGVLMQVGS